MAICTPPRRQPRPRRRPQADKGRKEALLRAGLAVAEAALARAEEGDAESALCHKAPRRDVAEIRRDASGAEIVSTVVARCQQLRHNSFAAALAAALLRPPTPAPPPLTAAPDRRSGLESCSALSAPTCRLRRRWPTRFASATRCRRRRRCGRRTGPSSSRSASGASRCARPLRARRVREGGPTGPLLPCSPWRVARRCPDTLSQSGHPLRPHSDPAGGWHRLGRGERREAAVWAGARVDVRRGALETLDADRASWYSGEHSRPHLVARARPRGAGVQCTRLCYSRAVCSLTSGARLLRAGLGAQAEQEGGEWPRGKGRRLESGRERWGCGARAPPPSHCGDRHPISGRVQGEPRLRQALARRRLGGLAHACARAARRRRGRR